MAPHFAMAPHLAMAPNLAIAPNLAMAPHLAIAPHFAMTKLLVERMSEGLQPKGAPSMCVCVFVCRMGVGCGVCLMANVLLTYTMV